jgi:hypothetical protein
MSFKKQLEDRLEHNRKRAIDIERQEWERWLETPMATYHILQCPELAIPPTERNSSEFIKVISYKMKGMKEKKKEMANENSNEPSHNR